MKKILLFLQHRKQLFHQLLQKQLWFSGIGKAKEKVILELYQKSNHNTYVCNEPIEITIGALGVFSKELDISVPKNVFVLAKIYRKVECVKDGRLLVW